MASFRNGGLLVVKQPRSISLCPSSADAVPGRSKRERGEQRSGSERQRRRGSAEDRAAPPDAPRTPLLDVHDVGDCPRWLVPRKGLSASR